MPASLEFDVNTLMSRIMDAFPRARKEATAELYKFGEEVMEASKAVVPMDTGALANTGQVQLPVDDGDVTTVTLGYGDESAPYALYVHENLDPGVHWTRPGSGPKYLENPLKERQDQLPGRILDAIRRGMKA